MAKLPRVTEEVKDAIYTQISHFGGVREKAFVKYAAAAVLDASEETEVNSLENLGYKALRAMEREGLVISKMHGPDHVVVPARDQDSISYDMLDAFEAFVALIYENRNEKGSCEFSHALPGDYPFDCMFSITGSGMYRVIVLNNTAMGRINFFNGIKDTAKEFTTLLVISSNYSDEALAEFFAPLEGGNAAILKGKYRFAVISRDRKNFDCQISPVMGDEQA